MDKNQIIGMTLLSLLFIGYISFVDPPQEELTEENVITQTDNTTLDDKTTIQL